MYQKLLSKEEGTYHTVIIYEDEIPSFYTEYALQRTVPEVFNGQVTWIENNKYYRLDLQETFDIALLPGILVFDSQELVFRADTLIDLKGFLTREIDERTHQAVEYIESLGYEVVQYIANGAFVPKEYNLFKNKGYYFWISLDKDPEPYFDQTLYAYQFYVKNHPLDDMFGEGKSIVTIMFYDDQIIGGTSIPYSRYGASGGSYMLDGTNAFDVKDTYSILKDWRERFDDN